MPSRITCNHSYILVTGRDGKPRALGWSEWIDAGIGFTLSVRMNGKIFDLDGVMAKGLISFGMMLLLVQSVFAIDGKMDILIFSLTTCSS